MILPMNSQHADPALTVRPDVQVKDAASRVLSEHGLQMQAFIVACLTALAEDPEPFLATLRPHWPPVKPRGRPRRGQGPRRPASGAAT
jgi:hypothetical protein